MPDIASLDLTPAERLLLACCQAAPGFAAVSRALQLPDLDWATFWDLAGRQEVRPLVARTLARARLLDELPAPARTAADAARVETTAQNLAARAELRAIASELGNLGIPVMPLKGVELAQRVYGGLDARRCGDIDILVRERDWEPAWHALRARGYRPLTTVSPGVREHPFHDVPLVRTTESGGFAVELHHQLTDQRFTQIDHDNLWRRALPDRGAGIVEMPPEELLVYLALHLPKHDTGLLRLVADIDHLIASGRLEICWERALDLAVLAVVALAPAIQRAGREPRAGAVLGHEQRGRGARQVDPGRCVAVVTRSVPDLPVRVLAPAPHLAVDVARARRSRSGAELYDAEE